MIYREIEDQNDGFIITSFFIKREKMIALITIGFLFGERLRDRMYEGRKCRQYSGLFILLSQKIQLNRNVIA